MGTVGTMIYTKKVGAVTADCAKSEAAEGWTCKLDGVDISGVCNLLTTDRSLLTTDDGVDISGVYKQLEPSSPGVPTACKDASLPSGLGPTFCELVGPFADPDGGGHRALGAAAGSLQSGRHRCSMLDGAYYLLLTTYY